MIVVVKYAFEEVRNWVEEAPAKEAREGTEAVQATPARREVFQADQVPAVRPEGEEEELQRLRLVIIGWKLRFQPLICPAAKACAAPKARPTAKARAAPKAHSAPKAPQDVLCRYA